MRQQRDEKAEEDHREQNLNDVSASSPEFFALVIASGCSHRDLVAKYVFRRRAGKRRGTRAATVSRCDNWRRHSVLQYAQLVPE